MLADFQRLRQHLPDEDDIDLIILKGHLLLEESLERIIRTIVAQGDLLKNDLLSFYQKAWLARAMSWSQHRGKLWDLILTLNTLRNALVHHLEPPEFDAKVKAFLASASTDYGPSGLREEIRNSPVPDQLRHAIVVLMGFLGSCEQDARAYRKAVGGLYTVGAGDA